MLNLSGCRAASFNRVAFVSGGSQLARLGNSGISAPSSSMSHLRNTIECDFCMFWRVRPVVTRRCVSVFGAAVYIDVDKTVIKALLTLVFTRLKDT